MWAIPATKAILLQNQYKSPVSNFTKLSFFWIPIAYVMIKQY